MHKSPPEAKMHRSTSRKLRLLIVVATISICAGSPLLLRTAWLNLNLWQYGLTGSTSSSDIQDSRTSGRLLATFTIAELECGPGCHCLECWAEKVMLRESIGQMFCIRIDRGRFASVELSPTNRGLITNDGSPCIVHHYVFQGDYPTAIYLDGKPYRLIPR